MKEHAFPPRPTGFSLIEITIVLVIAAVLLSIGTIVFSGYNERIAAQRAAQVFSRDLILARGTAIRGRERVAIRFYESAKYYLVATASGRELARRRFGTGAEFTLSAVDLAVPGDTLSFSSRGFANFAALGAAIGTATFKAGNVSYQVQFNGMGTSKVAGS